MIVSYLRFMPLNSILWILQNKTSTNSESWVCFCALYFLWFCVSGFCFRFSTLLSMLYIYKYVWIDFKIYLRLHLYITWLGNYLIELRRRFAPYNIWSKNVKEMHSFEYQNLLLKFSTNSKKCRTATIARICIMYYTAK